VEPFFGFHVEHIVAPQHGGRDDSGNLAFVCYDCNAHKGPNLSGIDPESSGCFIRGRTSDLHFERNGVLIEERTVVGRTTVGLLKTNAADFSLPLPAQRGQQGVAIRGE
jgi:HNH endonuclease